MRIESRVQKWRASIAIGLAFMGLAGCAAEEPATRTFEVAGRVVEDSSGRGISGARVTFVSDTRYESSTRTDSDGRYEMAVDSDVPFGQVKATKSGFQPVEATVYFDSSPRRVDLRMRARPE